MRTIMTTTAIRWLRFNLVGAAGVAVQLGTLAMLLALGLDYLPAAGLAVETAILHNFLWHEAWTWRDRGGGGGAGKVGRLARFHLANGAVSLLGNLAVTALLVECGGLSPLVANAAAIGICGLVNFLLSDRWVFGCRPPE